ncbi:MAG: cytidine deaminase [Defluviitaleaceae bacterium]|nr:cytidine deaminase [Defluviitaleaceae bacterium]
MDIKNLIKQAIEAREMAYAPYSGFKVGAALLSVCGKVYTGCNVENAAFTPGICAERTAVSTAVADGVRKFSAIAVVGGADHLADDCFPCGVCRQVLMEFCPPGFQIIVAKSPEEYRVFTLGQLLPHGFGPSNLE